MNILVLDGQGGRMGKTLTEEIRKICPEAEITAVGTNSIATGNMMKADCADHYATGRTRSSWPAVRRTSSSGLWASPWRTP